MNKLAASIHGASKWEMLAPLGQEQMVNLQGMSMILFRLKATTPSELASA